MKLESIGKPKTKDADGPTGFNNSVTGDGNLKAVNYPSSVILAQTWDWYAAYQVGIAIGIEGNALGINGWYGPGGNTHRSAMGGRNFEYYSEDAFLSGTMCAYHVLGAKEQGIQVYIKHIGLNEDDASRANWDAKNGRYDWVTEQAFRENYLKPFEIAVKVGGANGLMASHTRTGGMKSSGSYAMLTAVVRDEWGFRGTVITDYYKDDTMEDMDECIRAGCNQMLHPDGYVNNWLDDTTSDAAKYYVHKSAKDLLYAYVDTMYYAETAQGLENGAIVGVSVVGDVFAWWILALTGLNIVGLTTIFLLGYNVIRRKGF
jgi:beta-glucosidase